MLANLRINKELNIVPFVSVDHMMKIVRKIGLDNILKSIAAYIEEDSSALRYIRDQLSQPGMSGMYENLDMIADPDDPRDLYGMILRSGSMSKVA